MLRVDNCGKCLFVNVNTCGYKVVPLCLGYKFADITSCVGERVCVHMRIYCECLCSRHVSVRVVGRGKGREGGAEGEVVQVAPQIAEGGK